MLNAGTCLLFDFSLVIGFMCLPNLNATILSYVPLSFGLRYLLILLTVPCTVVVFAMPEDFMKCPYHMRFCDFTLVKSTHTPVLLWTSHSSHGIHRK